MSETRSETAYGLGDAPVFKDVPHAAGDAVVENRAVLLGFLIKIVHAPGEIEKAAVDGRAACETIHEVEVGGVFREFHLQAVAGLNGSVVGNGCAPVDFCFFVPQAFAAEPFVTGPDADFREVLRSRGLIFSACGLPFFKKGVSGLPEALGIRFVQGSGRGVEPQELFRVRIDGLFVAGDGFFEILLLREEESLSLAIPLILLHAGILKRAAEDERHEICQPLFNGALREEALLLILDDKLVPGLFDELPESGVALPGLIHERVQTRGEDVFDVEDGREVGGQPLGQGAQAQDEVQETVDGGNVEAVPVTEDAVYPDPGRLRRNGIPAFLP